MSDTRKCYIRRKYSCWMEGQPHHKTALDLYIRMYASRTEERTLPPTVKISTEHVHGGQFVADFSYVGGHVYEYLDEYQNRVEIMMEEPERVALINRIVD